MVLDGDSVTTSQGRSEERIRQVVIGHFSSFYVDRDLESALQCVSDNVRWIGTKEHYIANDKEEYRALMQEELDGIPENCIINVVSLETVRLMGECYMVSGNLEMRFPYETRLSYFHLRFSIMVLPAEGDYTMVSIHTSRSAESWIAFGKENGSLPAHTSAEARKWYHFDSLTGLYTLEHFKKKVQKQLRDSEDTDHYAMLCTGVAHFERVNNLYGLKRADQMLLELAALLTTFSKDVKFSCRSVADHFLVFMTYQNRQELEQQLWKLCNEFWTRANDSYQEAMPRLGIGVREITDRNEEVECIVEQVNAARKGARMKKMGSVVFYDARTSRRNAMARKIENSMEEAMANGEFKAFLQPKYDLISGKIVGAEALCRWIRDDGSMVYPDEFIPVFEENGFIADLDYYMLNRICEMIHRREREGKRNVSISINQSRVLLQDETYEEKIASVLERYKMPGWFIELELTERIFQDDLTEFARTMGQVKRLGIQWSIDDFGTGYSSLNLLKELPADIIKIDKSFLDETETSETSKTIIRKTVELAQELDMHVVCEGVETESQAEYLRNIKCDMAQGYLYAKPMPMEKFEALLDAENVKETDG